MYSSDRTTGGSTSSPVTQFQPLLTASEAYPAFEREFLSAEREIHAAFRLFDLRTTLRSEEAREIGRTWFDLFVHTLDRGVDIHLTVSDFDPIGAAPLHRECWRTCRQVAMVREASRNGGRMTFHTSRHRARVGLVPRLGLGPLALRRLHRVLHKISKLESSDMERFLGEAPDLRRMTRRTGKKLAAKLFLPELWTTTHHHKIAVFDRKRLYVGGLDLNDRRYDTLDHDRAAEETWHDVQVLVEGPVVEAAQAHLEQFQAVTERNADPPPAATGFLRTLSVDRGGPLALAPRKLVHEIGDWHRDAIARAEGLIYLETQFFRDVPLARALARRARAVPGLGLILILPGAPEDVAFEDNDDRAARYGEWLQARALGHLIRGFGPKRLLIASPVRPEPARNNGRGTLHGAPIIYVHAKVSIFGDGGAAVSSANLNGRSLRWDTEAGIVLDDPDHVRTLRRRCMTHWLPHGVSEAHYDPDTALPLWQRIVRDNARTPPRHRTGFLVPHDPTPAADFGEPLPGVPPEAV